MRRNRRYMIESRLVNNPKNRNVQKALKKAIDIINDYIDEEGIYLLDVLDKNSETYWQIKDYVMSDWNLDYDAILEDWIEDSEANHEYGYNGDPWEPRNYIFNILRFIVGIPYDEAEKILGLR